METFKQNVSRQYSWMCVWRLGDCLMVTRVFYPSVCVFRPQISSSSSHCLQVQSLRDCVMPTMSWISFPFVRGSRHTSNIIFGFSRSRGLDEVSGLLCGRDDDVQEICPVHLSAGMSTFQTRGRLKVLVVQ